jgi:signal peptidase II
VVLADQVTKTLAVERLAGGGRHLFGPVSLVLTYNTGVAFSLLTGLTVPIVLVVATLVATLVGFARSALTWPVAAAVGLVLGGALGNLSDRLFRGHGGAVVDFVHVGIWPTFNLADSAIVVGCVALAVIYWRRGASSEGAAPPAGTAGAARSDAASSTPGGHLAPSVSAGEPSEAR